MATNASSVKVEKHSSTNTFEIVLIFILIVVLVILITMIVHYARRRRICYTNPSPWCHNDWECPNAPAGKQNVWNNLKNEGLLTDNPQDSRCYAGPSNGKTPSQKNCPNAWPFLNKRTQIVNTEGNADGNTLLVYSTTPS